MSWHPDAIQTETIPKDTAVPADSFWDHIHALENKFYKGLEEHDPITSTNALLELDRSIWQAQRELESEEDISVLDWHHPGPDHPHRHGDRRPEAPIHGASSC